MQDSVTINTTVSAGGTISSTLINEVNAAFSSTVVAGGTIDSTIVGGAIGANGVGVPTGGTTGQVLSKTSSTDYATSWVNPSAGSGTVTSVSSATTDATVANPTTTPAITIVSAPKLTTARNINGVAFDGSANITVADSTKEPAISAGTSAQYYRGDKTMQTLNQDAVPSGTTNKAYTATEQTKLAAISGTNTGDETGATIKTKLGITTLSGSNTGDQVIPTSLPPNGSASGDLSGSYPSPTVSKINGTTMSGLGTGILKNTTGTGVPSIAVAADFPTLNQNTTGTAAGLSANITESQVTNLTSDLAAKQATLSLTTTGTSGAATLVSNTLNIPQYSVGGGGDASTNTSTSVDGEITLFSGTAGKTLKRATGTGIAKVTSGVLSTATSGTDYAPGTAANATGIVKSTTATGALTTAVAADFPILNQNTTGTAGGLSANITESQVTNLTTDLAAKLTNITGLVTAGTNVTISGSGTSGSPYAISSTASGGGGGTVTSVDVSGGTTGLTTSGGPVSGSGTVTLAGTLGVANGGTGSGAGFTANKVLMGNGTSAISSGQFAPTSDIVGINDTQALTNKNLGSSVGINLETGTTGLGSSGNNHLSIYGSANGLDPTIGVIAASDTNRGVNVLPLGTGRLKVGGVNVPTISSTDAFTNKDMTSGTNTFPTFNQNTTGTAAGLSANIAESQVTNLTTDLAAKAPLASPTFTGTPVLSTATATSVNKVAITAPATSATLTIANLGTLATSGAFSITLTATAATNVTLPLSGTLMTLGNAETITGAKTFNSTKLLLAGSTSGTTTLNANAVAGAGTVTLPTTGTLATLAGTEALTNKTINGVTITAASGTLTLPSLATVAFGQGMTITAASGGNTYTLPAATDTLVGRATTDTLTNKTIAGATNSVNANTFTNPSKFSVYRLAGQNPGTGAIVGFDTKLFDTGSNVDVTTNKGRFTAPVAGFYQFTTVLSWANGSGEIYAAFYKNGSQVGPSIIDATASGTFQGYTGSIFLQLAAADYVEVFMGSAGSLALQTGTTRNMFTGYLQSVL